MAYYTEADLMDIVQRSAGVFNMSIVPDGALEIARRSRGTPRIANRLLKRTRDYAQVADQNTIDQAIADHALSQLQVDIRGLDGVDRKILQMMIDYYQGGPVGLKTIAANIGEENETIEEVYEPYLLQIGLLKRTQRGRMVTPAGYAHLGMPYPEK